MLARSITSNEKGLCVVAAELLDDDEPVSPEPPLALRGGAASFDVVLALGKSSELRHAEHPPMKMLRARLMMSMSMTHLKQPFAVLRACSRCCLLYTSRCV